MNRTQVTLIGRNQDTVSVINDLIGGQNSLDVNFHIASNGYADLLRGLDDLPDILIVDLSQIWREELEALNSLNKIPPSKRPCVIVIGSENNTEIMNASMKIGARGYFTHPIDVKSFKDTLSSIADEYSQTTKNENANVITVLNGKGGSGATMIASNLSHILAKKYNKRVALFDFHNVITSLPLYFDIGIQNTINDALKNINALDEVALKGAMEKYSENLFILSSRHDAVEHGIKISSDVAKRLLRLASKSFDFIIIDTPASLSSTASTILHSSDQILLVTQQSIPHMSETALIYKAMMKEYGIVNEKINIVINRYMAKDAIRIEDIKSALSDNVLTVPSDYKTVTTSLNIGSPLYDVAKRAKVTESIIDISEKLASPEKNRSRAKWTQSLAGMFQS